MRVSCRSRSGAGIVARAVQMRRQCFSSALRGAWARHMDGREAGGRERRRRTWRRVRHVARGRILERCRDASRRHRPVTRGGRRRGAATTTPRMRCPGIRRGRSHAADTPDATTPPRVRRRGDARRRSEALQRVVLTLPARGDDGGTRRPRRRGRRPSGRRWTARGRWRWTPSDCPSISSRPGRTYFRNSICIKQTG